MIPKHPAAYGGTANAGASSVQGDPEPRKWAGKAEGDPEPVICGWFEFDTCHRAARGAAEPELPGNPSMEQSTLRAGTAWLCFKNPSGI